MITARPTLHLLACAALLLHSVTGLTQERGAGVTRLLVTEVRVKPEMAEEWLALQREQVVPALKKAGIKQYTVFASRYRAMPGKSRDYMNFVRAEMFPVMRQAQENGTFSGLSVTVSVQGGEPGIITLNMFYPSFAPLDGPPPVAKTLAPEGTAAFLAKGAGLISQLEQQILRRVPELSF